MHFCEEAARGWFLFSTPVKTFLNYAHARIGEHQCWVIVRNERRRANSLVSVVGKVIKKGGTDMINATHLIAARLSGIEIWARSLVNR